MEGELNYALSKGRTIVPLLSEDVATPGFLKKFPNTFRFSTWNTGAVEAQVVEFLKAQKVSKENRQAVGALVAIGLGLLLLKAIAKE